MKTIAIISNKGGVGKSTLAINLAVAGLIDGHSVALIDLDPQASTSAWGDSRNNDNPAEEGLAVISVQHARLAKVLATAQEQVDLAILDTAPHSEASALAAAKCADLILVPCRPAILDLRAISLSIDLLQLAKKAESSWVVLNACSNKSTILDARNALANMGIKLAPIQITQRIAFQHSLVDGAAVLEYEPNGKAAHEISQLYCWIKRQIGLLEKGKS